MPHHTLLGGGSYSTPFGGYKQSQPRGLTSWLVAPGVLPILSAELDAAPLGMKHPILKQGVWK